MSCIHNCTYVEVQKYYQQDVLKVSKIKYSSGRYKWLICFVHKILIIKVTSSNYN